MDAEIPARPTVPARTIHVTCPECGSPTAVVAHRYFAEVTCFCPACDHAWDCDTSILLSGNP
jgi:hypothetical protein